ncbi:phosphate ABC transporter permease subunit PstC [Methanolobus vulcani]|uniref:Phosphate transport system permease protein n=1 Tax=Methanolobus vulcani TaxID=38026 RepID=A0A7Z8KRH1_9EURY|nr:phosphate ABC transporter permease subunit PstC [Methanolobus vulcani]TQD25679.1 phosphate ABC transporter permease subunit PstC [Methanolobus vulcani]
MQQFIERLNTKLLETAGLSNNFKFKNADNLFFSAIAGMTLFLMLFIIIYVFYVASPVLLKVGLLDFITGTRWNYGASAYGIWNYALSTIYLTVLTLLISVPLGLFAAIFLTEFASKRIESILRPLIELLVGIPSVVYGIFGFFILEDIFRHHIDPFLNGTLGVFLPIFRDNNPNDGFSLLLASTVLAVMVLPTIVTLSQDAIRMVSKDYRDASFSLGATKWETIKNVVLPAAKGGITASVILGAMRAMGETMAVLMLYGGSATAPVSILDSGTAMTSLILGDLGSNFNNDEAVSALFAIAALLFGMEIFFVIIIKLMSGSYGSSKA